MTPINNNQMSEQELRKEVVKILSNLINELPGVGVSVHEKADLILTLISHERAEAHNEGYLKGAKQERVGIEKTYKDIRAEAVRGFDQYIRDHLNDPVDDSTLLEEYLSKGAKTE